MTGPHSWASAIRLGDTGTTPHCWRLVLGPHSWAWGLVQALTNVATGIGPLGWTLVSKTSQLVWAWIARNVAREANDDDVATTVRWVARPGEGGLGHDGRTNPTTRLTHHRPVDTEERARKEASRTRGTATKAPTAQAPKTPTTAAPHDRCGREARETTARLMRSCTHRACSGAVCQAKTAARSKSIRPPAT